MFSLNQSVGFVKESISFPALFFWLRTCSAVISISCFLLELFFRRHTNFVVSNLLFADDMLVFLNGKKRNLSKFTNFLSQYEEVSGQLVNHLKSGFITSSKNSLNMVNLKTNGYLEIIFLSLLRKATGGK